MTALADRIRARILATGAVTESGISRAARIHACLACTAPVIRALDADLLAFDVCCDPDPIDSLGETLALATGRRTYDAVSTRTRLELEPRNPYRIRQPRRYPVLAEHRCGQPLPADAATDERQELDEPPF